MTLMLVILKIAYNISVPSGESYETVWGISQQPSTTKQLCILRAFVAKERAKTLKKQSPTALHAL